jgi:integrase
MLYWRDPVTGKRRLESSGTQDEEAAWRKAGVRQDELNSGRYVASSKLTWAAFRERYEAEKLAALAPHTVETARGSLAQLERVLNPGRLAVLTAAALSRFQADLRKEGARDTTIAKTLRHVKAALRWAEKQGLLRKAPAIEMPRANGHNLAKSRPVTTEEYERLLLAVPKVRPHDAPAWTRFVEGLWLSGLRLGEAVALSWDVEAGFRVDFQGGRPVLVIQADAQKSRKNEVCPIAPDFGAWLLAVPEAERVGKVFPLPINGHDAGVVVGRIGKKAGVLVGTIEKAAKVDGKLTRKTVKLFAGAHSLRRSFAVRWSKRVPAAVLRRLMRHSSVVTTLAYYAVLDAADLSADLWAKWGGETGKNPPAYNTPYNNRPAAAGGMAEAIDAT